MASASPRNTAALSLPAKGCGIRAAIFLLCSLAGAQAHGTGTATPTDIPGLRILDANVPANQVNAVTVGAAGNPPFEPGTSVYEVQTTQPFVAIRSYYSPADPAKAGQAGSWISPIAETRGLSRAMQMDRLALPIYPDGTRNNTFALVLVPAGVTFWSGPAGPITNSVVPPVGTYWGAGGGIQYYVGRNAGGIPGFQVPRGNYVLAAPMGETNLLAYSPRLAGNALAVGRYLEGLDVRAYGDLDRVLTALDLLNLSTPAADPRLPRAIAQLGAERHGALGLAALFQSRLFMDQLTAAAGGLPAADRQVSAADDQGRRTWAQVLGARARQSSDGNRTGFTQNTGGFVAGIELVRQADWHFGAAAGYLASDLDWADGAPGQGRLKAGYAGAYGRYRQAGWLASGQLVAGYGSIDTRRPVAIPDAGLWPGYSFAVERTARASTSAFATGARFDLAHPLAAGGATLSPFVGLEYQRLDRRGFTEEGAGSINLAVRSQTLDDLRLRLGAALEAPLGPAAALDWSLQARLLASHRLGGSAGNLAAGFDGQGGSFPASGWRLPDELVQAGIDWVGRSRNAAVALTYSHDSGKGFEAGTWKATAAWFF
ncbi:MAG: outer rane autotransporter barrel domain protein [Rhodocyclaceae bacterium]|nr:outer rane autotransporter barrel domain protein [Rhodocyclaceae bacterium]